MEKILNEEQLRAKVEHCSKCLDIKFNGKDGKKHLVICGDTACVSSRSDEIYKKILEIIKEQKLEDKVTINKVGCFGFCSQGPFIKVYPEQTLYCCVKVEDAERIIKEDVLEGKVIEDLLYEDPKTKQRVPHQEDIGFYKKQKRVALDGCSIINQEEVDEALGYGAFKGLVRALHMSQQEVVDEILKSGLRGRGGGGFPPGRKWQFALNHAAQFVISKTSKAHMSLQ